MFCPKCNGIQDVIKIHEEKNLSKPRLCDVQCLECGEIVYYQPYDWQQIVGKTTQRPAGIVTRRGKAFRRITITSCLIACY